MALEQHFHLLFLEDLRVRTAPTVTATLHQLPGLMPYDRLITVSRASGA